MSIDIDDRSISFAKSNAKRNHVDSIKIIKNNSTDIFPAFLFEDYEQR